MRMFRSARWILMALLLSLVPASSFAGVFISVGFAPPVLPVYEQPPCPEPGLMWTPGYWAYGEDGYYWVPGAWVPAPYEGALWTPGYWGWSSGLYMWHGGYWGRHVGYYGGVNYGFGYMGVGFVGGLWRGHDFVYNTAVVHVNDRVIHNVYVDRTIVQRNTIVNDRHVAFSGGPGGINHRATADERIAEHDQHTGRTSFQTQHVTAARNDHNSYFKANGGRPQTMAVARPLGGDNRGGPSAVRGGPQGSVNAHGNAGAGGQGRPQYGSQGRPGAQGQPRNQAQPQSRPQFQPRTESRPAPQARPESRPAPQARPESRPESRPAPQARPQHEQGRPQHEDHKQ